MSNLGFRCLKDITGYEPLLNIYQANTKNILRSVSTNLKVVVLELGDYSIMGWDDFEVVNDGGCSQ